MATIIITITALLDYLEYNMYLHLLLLLLLLPLPLLLLLIQLGCGNSPLGIDMYRAGFGRTEGGAEIVNIDISPSVISQMRARYDRDFPAVRWLVKDVTALDFPAGKFDCVFDKGTLDALMCSDVRIPLSQINFGKYLMLKSHKTLPLLFNSYNPFFE